MSQLSPRSGSPAPGGSADSMHMKIRIKDMKTRLHTAKQDLDDFPIPRLKETIIKTQELLDLCKRAKGSKDVIEKFLGLVTKLTDSVLEPVLKEKRVGEVEISDDLSDRIQGLFRDLLEAVSVKRQLVTSSFPWFQNVDVGSTLADVNLKFDTALETFSNAGGIQCDFKSTPGRRLLHSDKRGHLVQDSSIDQLGQPDNPEPIPSGSGVDDLEPTVHSVLRALPKFRILLLGKSGAGKSSIINHIFKVPLADVAHFRAGGANINGEITSPNNPHFVLHDSIGFESGSMEQFQVVENFIRERSEKADVSEQIHAIWLCAAVPMAGARLFEVGDERLFQMDLGKVPLIVVFTKYDMLVDEIAIDLDDDNDKSAQVNAEKELKRICVEPLDDIVKKKLNRMEIPSSIKVSVKAGYQDTISELVQLTRKKVASIFDQVDQVQPQTSGLSKHIRPDGQAAWLTWSIAQRADADTSVEASIAVGRKKYWTGLGLRIPFRDEPLKRCVDALHDDIVLVWNFYDPLKLLISEQFKALMSQSVDDLVEKNVRNTSTMLASGISAAAGATGLVGALFPPGALVVGPIAVAAVFGYWMYDVYKQTPGTLRCLMAYIVDLTIVMRRLFWHMQQLGGIKPLPEDLLLKAMQEFSDSRSKKLMHAEIRVFVEKRNLFDLVKKGVVLDEVVRLITKYRFDPVEHGEE